MSSTLTRIMENSHSQAECEEETPCEQNTSQYFSTDGQWHSQRQAFGQGFFQRPIFQGLFAKGGGSAFPPRRLIILSLALLNAVLLIVAIVLAIYCAKANDLQIPYSAASPLMIEVNYLRNHSGIIGAKIQDQAALVRERTAHLGLKLQVKQKKAVLNGLQGQIETLKTEQNNLRTNQNTLEESCNRCHPGWILLKKSCYSFSNLLSDTKKNWHDSRADCISQGSDLLVINNLEEQITLNDNTPKPRSSSSSSSSSGTWWKNGFWIGLSDAVTPGTWVWVNNVTEMETTNWRIGQPNPSGPQSGNCAAFHQQQSERKTWYNGNCSDHQFNWICEMEPN